MDGHTNIIARDDTLLGVCQGLGEDLGFNPVWLRVALSFGLLYHPEAAVGVYFALGAVVLLSRLVFPNPRTKPAADAAASALPPPAIATTKAAQDKVAGQLLPLAA